MNRRNTIIESSSDSEEEVLVVSPSVNNISEKNAEDQAKKLKLKEEELEKILEKHNSLKKEYNILLKDFETRLEKDKTIIKGLNAQIVDLQKSAVVHSQQENPQFKEKLDKLILQVDTLTVKLQQETQFSKQLLEEKSKNEEKIAELKDKLSKQQQDDSEVEAYYVEKLDILQKEYDAAEAKVSLYKEKYAKVDAELAESIKAGDHYKARIARLEAENAKHEMDLASKGDEIETLTKEANLKPNNNVLVNDLKQTISRLEAEVKALKLEAGKPTVQPSTAQKSQNKLRSFLSQVDSSQSSSGGENLVTETGVVSETKQNPHFESDLETLRSLNKSLQEELEKTKSRNISEAGAAKDEIKNLKEELVVKNKEIIELKAQQKESAKKILAIKETNDVLEKEEVEAKRKISELLKTKISLESTISEMKTKGVERVKVDGELKQLKDLLAKKEGEIEKLSVKQSEQNSVVKSMEAKIEELIKKNSDTLKEKEELKVTSLTLAAKYQSSQNEMVEKIQKEIEVLKDQLVSKDLENNKIRQEILDQSKEKEEGLKELKTLKETSLKNVKEIENLSSQVIRLRKENESLMLENRNLVKAISIQKSQDFEFDKIKAENELLKSQISDFSELQKSFKQLCKQKDDLQVKLQQQIEISSKFPKQNEPDTDIAELLAKIKAKENEYVDLRSTLEYVVEENEKLKIELNAAKTTYDEQIKELTHTHDIVMERLYDAMAAENRDRREISFK